MRNALLAIVFLCVGSAAHAAGAYVNDLTPEEVKAGYAKVKVTEHPFFGLGTFRSSHLNSGNVMANFIAGYAWEIKRTEMKAFWDFSSTTGGNEARFQYVGIGANQFFDDEDISPFVAGALGFGSSQKYSGAGGGKESRDSFVFNLGAGYQFFRHQRINPELSLNYNLLFKANTTGHPAVFGLRFTLYF